MPDVMSIIFTASLARGVTSLRYRQAYRTVGSCSHRCRVGTAEGDPATP